LYQQALNYAGLKGDETVYDLYSGIGTISLFLARHAKRVLGIESVPEAVEDARKNAELNQIHNVDFLAGDMKDLLKPEIVARYGKPEVIVTDPPRAGMHPDVVDTLIKLSPEKIVYVSCNVATQARDLQLLDSHFEVMAWRPVDMFPHTAHVENIVLLQKRKS
jgi:23S rRNA (uracil1939-C5)-methyltransferase